MILARNTETRLFYRMIIRGIIFAFEIKYNVTKCRNEEDEEG